MGEWGRGRRKSGVRERRERVVSGSGEGNWAEIVGRESEEEDWVREWGERVVWVSGKREWRRAWGDRVEEIEWRRAWGEGVGERERVGRERGNEWGEKESRVSEDEGDWVK